MSSSSESSESTSSGSSSSSPGDAAVTVRTREWDPATKELVSENCSSVFFGPVAFQSKSPIRVVNMIVEGASEVSNIKIGLTRVVTGGNPVNQTFFVGVFDSLDDVIEPSIPFHGVNHWERNDDPNNVVVGTKSGSQFESKYVAIMERAPHRPCTPIRCTFRWFFEFDYEGE